MADPQPPFEYLFFDSLTPEQRDQLAEMPRWFSTMPVTQVPTDAKPTFVTLFMLEGDDLTDVLQGARDWLNANGLPPGRRAKME